jgi:putative ATP-dependent endonuclease of OLD family
MSRNGGRLPIEDEVDVISVGTSFLRFLEVAKKLKKPVCVVTDNDRDYKTKVEKKYQDYNIFSYIKIFADNNNNLYSLEPQLVHADKKNSKRLLKLFNLDSEIYSDADSIIKYMENNKTECALNIFSSTKNFTFPPYIMEAIEWANV